MKSIPFVLVLFYIFSFLNLNAQITISGRVFSLEGEALPGALVSAGSGNSVLSDNYGFFLISVKENNVKLAISYLGYNTKVITLSIKSDTSINIYLQPESYSMNQVEIVARKDLVSRDNYSLINIPVQTMNKLPVIFGEKDVFKSIQVLPGIQPGLEGSSQVNIRGGGPAQNLVLIDGMPVYRVSHIFGFLSLFNSDAIKEMKLYKGGIPSYYTNLSSGVLDITMKDGSLKNRKIIFEQNIFTSKFSYDGYLVKDKLSMTVFLRKSLFDLLYWTGNKLFDNNNFETYGFSDFSTKIRWKINRNNTLSVSYFYSKDRYSYKSQDFFYSSYFKENLLQNYNDYLSFNNHIFSLRLFSLISHNLTFESIIGLSRFDYYKSKGYIFSFENNPDSLLNMQEYRYHDRLSAVVMRSRLRYFFSDDLYFYIGYNLNRQPQNSDYYSSYYYYRDTLRENNATNSELSMVFSPYFYFVYINKIFDLRIGLSNDYFIGKDFLYTYYSPRVSLKIFPQSFISMQFSYSKLYQNNHLLTTSSVSNPADFILPTSYNLKPIKSEIYDFSLVTKSIKGYDLSLSGYYKTFENLCRFNLGVNLLNVSENIMNYISVGKGFGYGLELLVSKNTGRLRGWISYTYSRSFREFSRINLGRVFPYKYDRPHVFNISVLYDISEKLQLSLGWNYYSGHNITLPTQVYIAGFAQYALNQSIDYFESVNNIRTPPYHRLDIAFNYHKPKKHSYWSFGIYNVYNRLNPVYLYPVGDSKLAGIALFPIMPFIGYKYQLDW